MAHPRTRRATASPGGTLLAAVLMATTLTACGATGGEHSAPVTTTPVTTAPPAKVTLDEHAAGTTVRVRVGTPVVVQLHSTYWSTPAVSDPRVLAPVGHGGSTPQGTCPPGGGCGLSSARFTATHVGTAHLTSHRTSCGEAMRCPPGRGEYGVTVTVTR